MDIYDILRRPRAWDLILAEEMANVIADTLRRVGAPRPPELLKPPEKIPTPKELIELPEELLKTLRPAVEREVVREPVPIVISEGNDEIAEARLTITKQTDLLSIEGQGIIRELSFLSDRSDIRVTFYKDDNLVFSKTFDELQQMSPFYSYLVATSYGDKYIFALRDIRFIKNFRLTITPSKTTRITLMYNYRIAKIPSDIVPYSISIGR